MSITVMNLWKMSIFFLVLIFLIQSCSKDNEESTINLDISPVQNADKGSSYTNSNNIDILINYYNIPSTPNSGNLRDAVAYIDANGDGFTDVFFATGEFQLTGELSSILAINDGKGNFTASTEEFNDNMPTASHARKSIVADFNNDGLNDIFVFDHGFDGNPYPGSNPKLIIQVKKGTFSWSKFYGQTGFHHGGAAADIDNDGDIDIFVGGFKPFFLINNGDASFEMKFDRFDNSIEKVLIAELIDVDKDGFIDLLAGAHEQEGDNTSIYWGNRNGSFTNNLRTIIPSVPNYGTILDFDAEDIDNDGDRDLIINRTGGGANNFYNGVRIQLLSNNGNHAFADISNRIDNPGTNTDGWFPWIRAQDIDNDGDIDFFPDNQSYNYRFINNGSGSFSRIYQ